MVKFSPLLHDLLVHVVRCVDVERMSVGNHRRDLSSLIERLGDMRRA